MNWYPSDGLIMYETDGVKPRRVPAKPLPPAPPIAPSPLIVRVGLVLWGDRWQSEMARFLDVSRNTVQNWRQGRSRPRPMVFRALAAIAVSRKAELSLLVRILERETI